MKDSKIIAVLGLGSLLAAAGCASTAMVAEPGGGGARAYGGGRSMASLVGGGEPQESESEPEQRTSSRLGFPGSAAQVEAFLFAQWSKTSELSVRRDGDALIARQAFPGGTMTMTARFSDADSPSSSELELGIKLSYHLPAETVREMEAKHLEKLLADFEAAGRRVPAGPQTTARPDEPAPAEAETPAPKPESKPARKADPKLDGQL